MHPEFENLKQLIMTWDKDNLALVQQILEGNVEVRAQLEAFLSPVTQAAHSHFDAVKDLQYLKNRFWKAEIGSFEMTPALKVFLNSLPIYRIDRNNQPLEQFPNWIPELEQLKIIRLTGCHLTKIPETIGQLSDLEILNLDNNQLRKLPQSIGQLKQLRKLQLDFNQIGKLPESIGQLAELEWLCLENNRVWELPQSCLQLKRLRWLSIEGTPLGKKHQVSSGMFIQVSSPRFAKFCGVI